VHGPREEKSDDSKDSFYEEFDQVFEHFPKYHMTILLGSFNEKVGRENIFKLVIAIESLQQDNNVNGFRIVNSSASNTCLFRNRCSRTETFTSTTELLLVRRLATRLTTY